MERYPGRFIIGFDDASVPPYVEKMIGTGGIAGIVLFSRNLRSPGQTAGLCGELQAIAAKAGFPPLIIAVDQEGGSVNRIGSGATRFPAAMALAATRDTGLASRVGRCMAGQLLSLGINMNFAPVLDLAANRRNPSIGVRSFGDDPAVVAAFGEAFAGGLEEGGIAAVAKHFPGLGSSEKDSHDELPHVSKSLRDMEASDIFPFARVIRSGISGIMIGHACYAGLSNLPAGLSEPVACGLLRRRLRFEGVSITDDLEMGAIRKYGSAPEAAVAALAAGVDLALICHSADDQKRALAEAGRAVSDGVIARRPAGATETRIRGLREKILRKAESAPSHEGERGDDLARLVAESAITVAGDADRLLPIRLAPDKKLLLLLPEPERLSEAEDGQGDLGLFSNLMRSRHGRTEAVFFKMRAAEAALGNVLSALGGCDLVVAGTCNAQLFPAQGRLIKAVADSGKPAVFVAFGNPCDVEAYPVRSARLAAYGSDPHSVRALYRILFGEITAGGRLPVKLNFK